MKKSAGVILILILTAGLVYLFLNSSKSKNKSTSMASAPIPTSCKDIHLTAPKEFEVTSYRIHWKKVENATGYNIRIDNTSKDPWNGYCDAPNRNDRCVNSWVSNGYLYPFKPNDKYRLWIHAVNNQCNMVSKPALLYFQNKINRK